MEGVLSEPTTFSFEILIKFTKCIWKESGKKDFFMSYYSALKKGYDIDKPRNLAEKSVEKNFC